jgi:hypothetical protein
MGASYWVSLISSIGVAAASNANRPDARCRCRPLVATLDRGVARLMLSGDAVENAIQTSTEQCFGCRMSPREVRIAAFVDGMIAVHSRSPAAHRVLMEEMPPDAGALAAHCQFEADYRSGCEAFFDANARARVPHPHTAAGVLAAAVAGVVHDAARQKNLGSALLRQHLIRLVESYLS